MFKFLLLFFIFIYLIGYISKVIFGIWIRKKFAQNTDNMNYNNNKKEGEVTINTKPSSKGKIDDSIGEFVDYEEVDE